MKRVLAECHRNAVVEESPEKKGEDHVEYYDARQFEIEEVEVVGEEADSVGILPENILSCVILLFVKAVFKKLIGFKVQFKRVEGLIVLGGKILQKASLFHCKFVDGL